MIQMKTITALFTNSRANIPGGAFAEKSRIRSWLGRIKNSGLSASIVLLLCILTTGCAEIERVGFRDFVVDNNRLIDIKMDNARFELIPSVNSQPVHPSRDFWLGKGEQVAVKFDTLELHWERIGAMCAIGDNNNSTPDCNVCDYCRNTPVPSDAPCFGVTLERNFSTQFDLVVRHEGFIPDPELKWMLSIPSLQILNGCSNSSTSIAFRPETSATYQIIIPKTDLSLVTSPFDVAAETKIHVIEKEMAQTAAYELKRETVDGTDFWTWEMTGDNSWTENFSPDLRVTNIRILKGRCEADPASGQECASTGEVVKPSSLFFLPNFRANNPLTVSGFSGVETIAASPTRM